ncbi:hypothetical protein JYU20_00175 [Bacteroidales bacterium AH-315-I05]|nr:hypothetical protein [Bacteroidales bacterium AH-315-I05]
MLLLRKKYCLLLLLLLPLLSKCQDRIEKVIETYENGKTKIIYVYEGNVKDENIVEELKYYENGQLWCRTEFTNGKANGEYTCWDEKGSLWAKGYMENGNLDDTTFVYEYGILTKGRVYEDNEVIKLLTFHPNSQVESELNYKQREPIGKWYGWYETGELELEVKITNGPWLEYYKSGKKKVAGQSQNGRKNGVFKCFNEQGGLLKEITYEKGVAIDSVLYEVGGENNR